MCSVFAQRRWTELNEKDNGGMSALMLAAEQGHVDCVQYMVKKSGAQVNVKDNSGHASLSMASTTEIRTFLQRASVASLIAVFIHGMIKSKKSSEWLSMDNIRMLRDMLI